MTDDYEAFDNAELAWFWYCNCLLARGDGLRARSDYVGIIRGCEVCDIEKIVRYMRMRQEVSHRHLRIMYKFGALHVPPHYEKRAKSSDIRLWEEGIKVLEGYLLDKRIIANKRIF